MKKLLLSVALLGAMASSLFANNPKIEFEEYTLDNGLHVILYEDNTIPIVNVSVMYHVGSKNEHPERTGFAHFFEHLMFEGTENIGRGEYMKIIEENGGSLNAFTSNDVTYYFQTLPSNQLELGLWMESERMLHPVIDSIGIETQRKVVQEEKKQRYDNTPYGQLINVVFESFYKKHPYRWSPIGKEQYIDQATHAEFMEFFKTFYVPNNAVLIVAGDIKGTDVKSMINKYFGTIPKGTHEIPRPNIKEDERTKEERVEFKDDVQIPAVILAFQAPKAGSKDYYAIEMLNSILSNGASSRLNKQIVDKDQKALAVMSAMFPLEDPSPWLFYGIANMQIKAKDLEMAMKEEIEKLVKNGVTANEFERAKNQIETDFVSQNSSISGIAQNLAFKYTFFKDANLINTDFANYQNVTLEDVNRVAKQYLKTDRALVIHYLPK